MDNKKDEDKPITFLGKLMLIIGFSLIGIPIFVKLLQMITSFWNPIFSRIHFG